MTPQTLTTTPAVLRELLTKVLPFTERSGFYPALEAVRLEARGGNLTATATDRYILGMAKVPYGGEPFVALIPAATCKQLLRFYPVIRKGDAQPVILVAEDGKLTTSQPGAALQITCTSDLATGTYPDLDRMLAKALAVEAVAQPVTYNGKNLAAFAHLGELTVLPSGSGKMALVLAHGFVGVAMSLSTVGGSRESSTDYAKRMVAEWSPLLPATDEGVAA